VARYSAIFTAVWNDARLDGLPFEGKAFFIYLCCNERVRPSGIYRATDELIAVDTSLPIKRVRAYLEALALRRRIVRDGAWIFVQGFLKRQPKQDFLLKGVAADVAACYSPVILTAFGEKYPHYKQWSDDRLATIGQWSVNSVTASSDPDSYSYSYNGRPTVAQPSPTKVCTEVLDYLNRKAGKTYRPSETNLGLIRGRLDDGIHAWQLKAIVGHKVAEWAGDPKMTKYLRPATLFNKIKCEQYLGELPPPEPVEAPHA
jgi:uncharacterized phage protein (TIGR02220 family)